MFDILDTVDKWLTEGKQIALGTVVETWGSSPRQAGAKIAITSEMAMIGSVSGGCVETAVVQEALDSLGDGKPRLLHYGISDDTAWSVGLACGGKMSVFVEPLDKNWWTAATEAARQNRAAITVTVIDGEAAGQKILLDSAHGIVYQNDQMSSELYSSLSNALQSTLERRRPEHTRIADLDVLIDVHRPYPRLVIIGGAHVAMALKDFANLLGYRVYLIDPRSAFATPERFPDVVSVSNEYPDRALTEMGLDADTYIAVLTHDPKIDDPALRTALPSPAAYVGVLSSKRSHEQRIERLTKGGLDPALLDRIHTPIGLDLGAKSPEEIALSIMAEIVKVRNDQTRPSNKES